MTNKDISTLAFRRKLKKAVDAIGGTVAAGREWGSAYQHISAAISGRSLPNPAILKAMGYESIKDINYRYREL